MQWDCCASPGLGVNCFTCSRHQVNGVQKKTNKWSTKKKRWNIIQANLWALFDCLSLLDDIKYKDVFLFVCPSCSPTGMLLDKNTNSNNDNNNANNNNNKNNKMPENQELSHYSIEFFFISMIFIILFARLSSKQARRPTTTWKTISKICSRP